MLTSIGVWWVRLSSWSGMDWPANEWIVRPIWGWDLDAKLVWPQRMTDLPLLWSSSTFGNITRAKESMWLGQVREQDYHAALSCCQACLSGEQPVTVFLPATFLP